MENKKIKAAIKALKEIKAAIINADPDVLTCTLWMPDDVLPGATVVDRIDIAIKELRAKPQPPTPPVLNDYNVHINCDWKYSCSSEKEAWAFIQKQSCRSHHD